MNILSYRDRINRATAFLAEQIKDEINWCVILGSGLGGLGCKLEEPLKTISYDLIPGFPKTTVEGHAGHLVYGKWNGRGVVVMEGRFHRYEGHDFPTLVLPVRVLMNLGVSHFFITNAAGGIREDLIPGDLMVLSDHLNLMGGSPLSGENLGEFGVRFPAMTNCYSPELRELMESIAQQRNLQLKHGVYAALEGPSYETAAEIKMLKAIGADAVGMSTVPEVIAIKHAERSVTAVSLITNATGGSSVPTHEEVVEMADRRRKDLHLVILDMIRDAAF